MRSEPFVLLSENGMLRYGHRDADKAIELDPSYGKGQGASSLRDRVATTVVPVPASILAILSSSLKGFKKALALNPQMRFYHSTHDL